jgi:hypothetical protein
MHDKAITVSLSHSLSRRLFLLFVFVSVVALAGRLALAENRGNADFRPDGRVGLRSARCYARRKATFSLKQACIY